MIDQILLRQILIFLLQELTKTTISSPASHAIANNYIDELKAENENN